MRWIPPIIALSIGLAGCTTCHHRAGDLALEGERCPEAEASQRTKVHAIIVKGFDPLDLAGAETLVETLVESGFPKIYRIESHHAGFIEREARRVLRDRPDARFVIVGSGSGAMLARHLACRIASYGGSVDAIIEVAPVLPRLLGGSFAIPDGTRHLVVGRIGALAGSAGPSTEYRIVSRTGIWSTCSHPVVMDWVKEQMIASSQMVSSEEDATTVTLPILERPAPLPGEMNFQVKAIHSNETE
jgi:hypothetical protein